jgi:hypothetical protein
MAHRENSNSLENYQVPAEDLSAVQFLSQLLSHASGIMHGKKLII